MACGYVIIKLYQHHVIESAVDAINVLMYFVVVAVLFLLLANIPCKQFVKKRKKAL